MENFVIESIEEKLCGNMENIGKKCNNCVLDDCAGDGVALYHIAIFFISDFFQILFYFLEFFKQKFVYDDCAGDGVTLQHIVVLCFSGTTLGCDHYAYSNNNERDRPVLGNFFTLKL